MADKLLDKQNGRIQRMFAEIAPWYDTLNHVLSLNIDKRWRRRTVATLPVEGNAPILDVCTGTGDLALEFDRASQGTVPVIGSDFCHPMLVRAEHKAKRKNQSNLTFVEADAQELPFASETFQITTVAFGLRNVADPKRGLAEMCRVTRPEGRVAILEFSQPRHWFFGRMYRAYFLYLLPLVGQIFSRSRDSAYKYLPASVMQFPDGEGLAEWMRQAGLSEVEFFPLTFGIATLYVGKKPIQEPLVDSCS